MVLKRLKLDQLFNHAAWTFSDPQAWVPEGGQGFEHFSKKGYFLSVECARNQISPLLDALEKLLENPLVPPMEKILPTPMHTSM